ncbi:HNH endonuclease [Candidatus Eisenbacteria bacterium]|uniref:HNH endonuclease n=1 Tax=Eiseniibacteriota bacterium TaxID=2212470 RepID=A0ABV6YMJ6_UNCEI
MSTWIFQGNMDRFDVDDYLTGEQLIYWTVTHKSHQRKVTVGDPVFIWRAKGSFRCSAGVVAKAYVCEPCRPKGKVAHPERLREGHWRSPDLEVGTIKAGLLLEDTRLTPGSGMLTRDHVASDPVLARSQIIRARVGSNFLLNNQQADRLSTLWRSAKDSVTTSLSHDNLTVAEGRVMYAVHAYRERNKRLVTIAKQRFTVTEGRLYCQLCGFSFETAYGEIGRGFIEAHHTKPVWRSDGREPTHIDDLMMVCANCHRMLHRGDPVYNLGILKELFRKEDFA